MGWSCPSTAASRQSESADLGECMIAKALTEKFPQITDLNVSQRRVQRILAWLFSADCLFHRGAVIRLQIAQRVLNPSAKVFQHRRHRIHPVAVSMPLVEHAAFALAANIAQGIVAIGAGIASFALSAALILS